MTLISLNFCGWPTVSKGAAHPSPASFGPGVHARPANIFNHAAACHAGPAVSQRMQRQAALPVQVFSCIRVFTKSTQFFFNLLFYFRMKIG
jgi:hypothetical protein